MTEEAGPENVWRVALYVGILGHLLVGLAHLASSGFHLDAPARLAFEVAALVGFPAALLGLVIWFDHGDHRPEDYRRLVTWGVAGTAATVAFAGILLIDHSLADLVVTHTGFELIIAADFGGLFGVIGGIQSVRARASARRAERAEARAELSGQYEDSLAFLHRILRHHVLNGVSVILGEAKRLEDAVDESRTDSLATIRRRADRMVEYVDDIRTVLTALSGDVPPTTMDLSAELETELESAEYAYPDATFEAAVPAAVTVTGSELLGVAIENVLENAVKHNDSAAPVVTSRLEDLEGVARLTIADTGPGMPDDLKSAYFSRGSHGEESLGEGLGLYLAESIVGISGGRIWIEDNDPRGTRVVMELPKPQGRVPAVAAVEQSAHAGSGR